MLWFWAQIGFKLMVQKKRKKKKKTNLYTDSIKWKKPYTYSAKISIHRSYKVTEGL
jgi:hypothetical protein